MKFTKYLKRKTLQTAFKKKLQHKYTLGTDGISTHKFSEIIDEEITLIKRKVKNLTYNISPYKEQLILKSRDSNPRMISIPTNRDKLVLNALQKFLAKKFKDKLSDDNVSTKIHGIKKDIESKKYDSYIKLDIESFYPSIDHQILLEKVQKEVKDEKALYLLEKALTQITIPKGRRKDKQNNIQTKGVPQGLSISNILSSVYLTDLDIKYTQAENLQYYRFVDDILILCNKTDVESIKESICEDAAKLLLTVHEFKEGSDKSSSGIIHKDKFQFLGFEFDNNTISVREQSIDKLRDRIITVFYKNIGTGIFKGIDYNSKDLYRELNLKISGCVYKNKSYGWMQFFRQIDNQKQLYSLDSFVKKLFKRFKLKYKETKIKKFTKTYFYLKNYDIEKLNNKSYIPRFEAHVSKKIKGIILDIEDDIEFY
ncbi:hypothetical protein JHD48_08005 [Sulfurimonas sp. SAG-AH-194-I05]|nr:reverse transcriptase domain-containing protein [Sulfurimonas sp. SAG-AH-194-I05]MDF1875675.1 hypothetical protein [Sulfurimonas sp. SAG-AH-194-I05]